MRNVLFWVVAILLVGTLSVVLWMQRIHRQDATGQVAPVAQVNPSPPASAATAPSTAAQTEADTPIATHLDAMRRGIPISQEAMPLATARVDNNDVKRERAYPMQPPTIPHSIDNYQVDKNYNRCLMCHTRTNAAKFQAPAISVTHYLDRDGHVLAQISSRRYFCVQCHVVQTNAKPLVMNTFQDEETVIQAEAVKHSQ